MKLTAILLRCKFFQLVLPNENKVPSLYKLEKSVGSIGIQPKLYNLCSKCHSKLRENKCTSQNCEDYQSFVPEKGRLCYYVMNIESSLKRLVKGKLLNCVSLRVCMAVTVSFTRWGNRIDVFTP